MVVKKNIKYEKPVQLPAFVCINHHFHRLLISSMTHAHPKFVYLLGINNYEQHQMKKIRTTFPTSL